MEKGNILNDRRHERNSMKWRDIIMKNRKRMIWVLTIKSDKGFTCSSAATINIAMVGMTAPFMVMDTDIFSSGMPLNRVFMSSTESIATPAIPTSPCTLGLSESYL